MIGVHLTGGIGNQMFIIAWTESQRQWGRNIVYTNIDFAFNYLITHFEWTKHAEEYKKVFKNFDYYKHSIAIDLPKRYIRKMYEDVALAHGYEYNGYFQSEKNFFSREFIEWLFEPAEWVKERMAIYDSLFEGNTCSLHVRRGNYLLTQDHHPVQGMDYYIKAIDTLMPFNIDRCLVFSDDLAWCGENFIGDRFEFIGNTDYIDLFLMAQCKHHIISNSAFGWWGAWLHETPDSVVIAPKTWFGSAVPPERSENIIPDRWIKL